MTVEEKQTEAGSDDEESRAYIESTHLRPCPMALVTLRCFWARLLLLEEVSGSLACACTFHSSPTNPGSLYMHLHLQPFGLFPGHKSSLASQVQTRVAYGS